jgi:transposase
MTILSKPYCFIEQLKSRVIELEQEIEKLKISRDLDSTRSSKPPSSDLLKKSEKKLEAQTDERETPKRKPGTQPGHPGKTRKGFGRVDRLEILRPQVCTCCGQSEFSGEPIKIERQQVAQLVERTTSGNNSRARLERESPSTISLAGQLWASFLRQAD